MTDKEILELYKAGEREKAFGEIVESYSERLYWHVRRFLCSHEDTDDLLQEIFIKIWSSLSSFRGDSSLYTWIYRIATNESLNFLQKQKIRAALRFESMRLPAKQRTVFIMRWFDDLSYEDISEILGTSVGALKASYHFASEKIKTELEKYLK